MSVAVGKLVNNLISGLDAKQREILEGRYGLKDGNSKTLAELGENYDITRERVRQIEAGALVTARSQFSKSGAEDLVDLVKNHLKNVGGVRRDTLLLNDLLVMVDDPKTLNLRNKVHFLLEVAGDPKFSSEDDSAHAYWYLTEDDKKKASGLISKMIKFMEERREKTVSHENVDKVFNEAIKPHNLKDLIALNYISISKQFHVNQFGNFGLSHWPEVNPRTMRDWAYMILKKQNKPAHFEEITEMINKIRKDSKKEAHAQTVHNELIKDERFVLVGRGTYGLQEFGLMPGTAKEVMGRLLEKHGALTPKELLGMVLKERIFKKNTILINLQNKKYFKRLEDGRYTVNLA